MIILLNLAAANIHVIESLAHRRVWLEINGDRILLPDECVMWDVGGGPVYLRKGFSSQGNQSNEAEKQLNPREEAAPSTAPHTHPQRSEGLRRYLAVLRDLGRRLRAIDQDLARLIESAEQTDLDPGASESTHTPRPEEP